MGCKPGPDPVLSPAGEDRLVRYVVEMLDMGFGLSRQDVMQMAFQLAEKSGISHPLRDGTAGRRWFEGV